MKYDQIIKMVPRKLKIKVPETFDIYAKPATPGVQVSIPSGCSPNIFLK